MAVEYTVRGNWATREGGHVFAIKAVNPAGGVIGKVVVHVDIDEDFELHDHLPDRARNEIEEAAEASLRKVVAARHGS